MRSIDGVVAWDTLFDFGQAVRPVLAAADHPIGNVTLVHVAGSTG